MGSVSLPLLLHSTKYLVGIQGGTEPADRCLATKRYSLMKYGILSKHNFWLKNMTFNDILIFSPSLSKQLVLFFSPPFQITICKC